MRLLIPSLILLTFLAPLNEAAAASSCSLTLKRGMSVPACLSAYAPPQRGLLKPFIEKRLAKRIGKKNSSSNGNGTGFVEAAAFCLLAIVICWSIQSVWTVLSILPLSLLGVIFSIAGIIRAKKAGNNSSVKILAVLMLFFNIIAGLFGGLLWGLVFSLGW